MTIDITQSIDHSIVTAFASGVASGVFIIAAAIWLSSTFTFVVVDIPSTLPIEVVVGLTAGVAAALFLCGYLLFTHLRGNSNPTQKGGADTGDGDGTVGTGGPLIGNKTGSSGASDPLQERLERRSDLNNGGGAPESHTPSDASGSATDKTPRESSQNREADRRPSDADSASSGGSADYERNNRDGAARELRLKDDEDENGAAEAEKLPEAYRHELPNLRE